LAYVLDKILGLKGLEENGVGLYENQPLVIVNKGEAKTEDIKNFAQKIQKRVKDELGIIIEFEVVEW
jgi:UDP-N-acetylmuramate dehydrogenase